MLSGGSLTTDHTAETQADCESQSLCQLHVRLSRTFSNGKFAPTALLPYSSLRFMPLHLILLTSQGKKLMTYRLLQPLCSIFYCLQNYIAADSQTAVCKSPFCLSALLVPQPCRINEFFNRNVAHVDFILIRVAPDSRQGEVLHLQYWTMSEAIAVAFIRHLFQNGQQV